MLKVSNVKKCFGNTEVLKGVNLEIKEGKILVVVGKSGGGKTTLLRCINALEQCDSGSIEINGNMLCKDGQYVNKKELRKIRKDIGFVFQSFNLFPHMSVLENMIEAPQRVLGMSREESIKKAEETLGYLGLSSKKDNYPCELSGGQKQRISIARVFLKNPSILILDEATSALDNVTEKIIQDSLEKLCHGRTTIVVAHRLSTIKNADEIVVLGKQGIIEKGSHDELIKSGGEYSRLHKISSF